MGRTDHPFLANFYARQLDLLLSNLVSSYSKYPAVTSSRSTGNRQLRQTTMTNRRSGAAEISTPRLFLPICQWFAQQTSFPSSLWTQPRFRSRFSAANWRGCAPKTSISRTDFNRHITAAPRTSSRWPQLSVAAPQPTLHNALALPEHAHPSAFPRQHAWPPVSSRHGARHFTVLRFVHALRRG